MDKDILITIDEFEVAEKYWLEKLSGELKEVKLVRDFPFTKQYDTGDCHITFGKEISRQLIQKCKYNDLSLFIFLLAAFKTLLFKYSGQDDIITSSPIYTLSNKEYNQFVALRDYIIPGMTFKELLMMVKETVIDAYNNEFYPFQNIIELLEIKSISSLCRFFLLLKDLHGDMSVTEKVNDFDSDIMIAFGKKDNGLVGEIFYNSKAFKRETIETLFSYYSYILPQVLDKPDVKLSAVEIITGKEKNKILFEFNNTKTNHQRDRTITELFEKQVIKEPDKVALILEDVEDSSDILLTFGTLNKKSNQLACILRSRGVVKDSVTGLLMESSQEMIISMIGVLKAGGAYLPLAVENPEKRNIYMLLESNAKILLTQKHLWKNNKKINRLISPGNILTLDNEILKSGKNFDPDIEVNPENLAYVIYTSGTTGEPKGVLIEHRGVVNYIQWRLESYQYKTEDISLQLLSYSFDGFVSNLYTSLLSGGTLFMVSDSKKMDVDYVCESIKKREITNMSLVPLIYERLLERSTGEDLKSLRFVVLAGEQTDSSLVKQSKKKVPHLICINEYGPTETTVTAAADLNMNEFNTIQIGKPISNTQIYILDHSKEPVPIGIPGELYISGYGAARGYLNNIELTGKSFKRNPFIPGETFYRSGDLSRWLPNGDIELLGRADHQVKIRGHRIEPEEIESQFLNHNEIKEVVVLVVQGEQIEQNQYSKTDKYLCAFLVPFEDRVLMESELREYLSQKLPDYMIPSHFVQLQALPLTVAGKVDRRSLYEYLPTERYVGPGNELEKRLVELWQEVLDIEKIGITDNFFQKGGDSIKAVQISARLREYNLKLDVKDIFLNPTIKQLGKCIKKVNNLIEQGIVEGLAELTPIQKWFFEKNCRESHHFNQDVVLFREEGFNESIIETVFTEIVKHHDALRIVYQRVENKIIQINRNIDRRLFDLVILDLGDEADFDSKIKKEANRIQRGIKLEEGPLVKLGLFKTRYGDHLLIVIHHLVIDGISWRILLEDFGIGYQQVENDEMIKFKSKTDSFKSWSHKLKEYSESKELLKELEYWKKIESTPKEYLAKDYETGKEKRKNRNYESITMRMSEKETQKLLKEVNWAYNTEINDVLLTALAMAIREWGRKEKILINLEGHGREGIIEGVDIGRTVGWFTTQYPVLLDLSGIHDLSYLIQHVKETLRRIPNKGIGYGILKYITPEEKKEGVSLELNPEIGFNYLGQYVQEIGNNNNFGEFRFSEVKGGETISGEFERTSAVDINGIIANNELIVSFVFNTCEYDRDTIEKLKNFFESNMINIIEHCSTREEKEMTPSDVGYTKISIRDLQKIKDNIKDNL